MNFEFSIGNATSNRITGTTNIGEAVANIRNGKWAAEVAAVRAAVREYEDIPTSADKGVFEAADKKIKQLKARLPGFLCTGIFNLRKKECIVTFSGLLCADIDDVPYRIDELLNIARNDLHVVAVFVSPSGTGIKIIFRVPIVNSASEHLQNFITVRNHVASVYNAQVDEAAKDVPRLCYASHDPNAFYNGQAAPLTVEKAPTASTNTTDPQPKNGVFGARQGARNNAAFKLACERRDLGQTQDEVINAVRDFASRCEPPLPIEEADACVRSAFTRESRDYKRGSAAETYLGGDAASSPAATDQPTLVERLMARIYSPTLKPVEPAPLFSLGDVPICTPGNLTVVSAQAKAGKSAAISAMITSIFAVPAVDCLGFSSCNRQGHAVLHIDTEQCPFDHWDGIERMLRRAKVDSAPPWLRSYCLTGFSVLDIRVSISILIKQSFEQFGGIHSVFVDGIADAVCDVNDSAETSALITDLHKLAIEFNCPIINIIHVNPSSDFKTRGHLGSQLERKSETNLRLEKNEDDVTVIWADKNRRAPIPKNTAPRFTWNDRVGMHTSVGCLRDAKDEGQKTEIHLQAERVFAAAKKSNLTYGDLVESVMGVADVSKSTAKRRVEQMIRLQIVRKDLAGFYSIIK